MLRLLLVAFPLVVALPAALDRHDANAIQFEVQPTLQFEVRSPPESRPLLPAATRDQHTTAPPHTHLRTHNTQAHASPCTRRGTRARARRSTPRSTSSPTSSSPRTPTHQTRRCAQPCQQPRMQRAQLSVGPAAARATGAHAAGAHAHARRPHPRLPQLRARREARRPPRDSTCARHQHVRTRRHACFADGLRVARPVQAAAAASGRARRPPRLRHLRHDRQARRRHHGHKMIRPPSRSRSPAWPRRREACACEAGACEPGAVVLEAAAPSAHCSSRSPSSAAPTAPA